MTRPPRKRGQGQKSKPKQVRPRPNDNADPNVGKSGAIPLITPNVNDSLVIQKLATTAAGALAVDSLVPGPSLRLPLLPNEHDNAVIRRLSTASLGSLTVDQFSHLLRKDSRRDDRQTIATLRRMLIRVYFVAADARHRARAAQWQSDLAQRALASVKAALTGLGEVRPKRQRG